QAVHLTFQQLEIYVAQGGDAAEGFGDAFHPEARHPRRISGGDFSLVAHPGHPKSVKTGRERSRAPGPKIPDRSSNQIRKWSSIHCIPAALALVTTGPSVTTFIGMPPSPVFSPLTAATPAMMAPPWMRQDGLRTVAVIRPSATAARAGGMASQPPILMSVRLCAFITL